MKKLLTMLMVLLVSFSAIVAPACVQDDIETGENVINVKIFNAGYGTDYIYALAEQFGETFKEEGYKVNVLAPMEDLHGGKVIQEIYANDQTADIYFTTSIGAEGFLTNDLGCQIEEMTDLFNMKPIGFDKKEESITIGEKLAATGIDFSGTTDYEGKKWCFPYVVGYNGLAVNTKLLGEFELATPVTTNEFFNCYETIMASTLDTDIRPMTYSVSGNGYPTVAVATWQIQASGEEEWNDFWSWENEDGSPKDCRKADCDGTSCNGHAWEQFNSEAVTEALSMFYGMLDYNTAALGSSSQSFTAAQKQLMKGESAFMLNGAWLLNEERVRHADYINDIDFIKIPLISSLGVKLFGEGTKYNLSTEDCDKVLAAIARGVDQNKSVEEIKTQVDSAFGITLDLEDVKTVCNRRGFVQSSTNVPAVISKKSANKDLAKLFLRFCASDDGGAMFADKSWNPSPFNVVHLKETNIPWHVSIANIYENQHTTTFTRGSTGYRKDLGLGILYPWAGDVVSNRILEVNYRASIYDDETKVKTGDYSHFRTKALAFQKNIVDHAKTQMVTNGWTIID